MGYTDRNIAENATENVAGNVVEHAAENAAERETEIRIYDELPEEASRIRRVVFVEEQGFMEEFDEIDGWANHLVLFAGGKPAGTCRVFFDEEGGNFMIGRLAVRKKFRGLHYGEALVGAAEQKIRDLGGSRAALFAQVRASGFYGKLGYRKIGEEFLEEYCPHIRMERELGV
mgnify:FL=1